MWDQPWQALCSRIILEILFYPVTLGALYQIFSKFSVILKMIMLIRNNQFQVLLQLADLGALSMPNG